jgi:plastocyanin
MRPLRFMLPVLLLLMALTACLESESVDDGTDDAGDEAAAAVDDPTATPEPEPTEVPEPTETPEPEPTEAPVATETPEPTAPADDDAGEDGPTEHIIEIQDPHDFVPDELDVAVGDTITWVNTGNITHTSTLDPEIARDPENAQLPDGAETWDSGNLEPGDEFSITLEVPGEYVYFCRPHEVLGQIGTITVDDDGDASVDAEDDDTDDDSDADEADDEDGVDDYL